MHWRRPVRGNIRRRRVGGAGNRASMGDDRQRLAAILAADAVGFSRHMEADERATAAALDAARAMFRSEIESHQGHVINMVGDSVLAFFETAAGAVTAAIGIQHALESAPAPAADRRLRFRIGVHLGDVVEKVDGDVYGDGVNIAARLQAMAPPGGVVVSEAVRGAVKSRIAAVFDDLGPQSVKNIADPIRAFAVSLPGAVPSPLSPSTAASPLRHWRYAVMAATAAIALAGAFVAWKQWLGASPDVAGAVAVKDAAPVPGGKPSIAVLPFDNMSGETDKAYFADGMTEDLITD